MLRLSNKKSIVNSRINTDQFPANIELFSKTNKDLKKKVLICRLYYVYAFM